MPRKARLDVPGALHHIIVRGINKTPIFGDDQDKTRFLERLSENITKGTCTVYAWVLMTNHLHLLFKSGKEGISAVMRKQLTWYAQYYNRRHTRTGHLFENRYKSILCDEDTYLLALIRYIHLNPIRREKGTGCFSGELGRNKGKDREPKSKQNSANMASLCTSAAPPIPQIPLGSPSDKLHPFFLHPPEYHQIECHKQGDDEPVVHAEHTRKRHFSEISPSSC